MVQLGSLRNLAARNRFALMSLPLCMLAAQQAGAVTINVSSEAQLRAAITQVNGQTSNDEIILAPGTYAMPAGASDNTNAAGDYDITKTQGSLIIRGNSGAAATTIVNAMRQDRAFHVCTTGAITVTFQDLTVTGGRTFDDGTTLAEALGGGILNKRLGTGATNSNITINNCVINGNWATGTSGVASGLSGADGKGGGVYSAGGTLAVSNTTFSANEAVGGTGASGTSGQNGGAGGSALGGAIYVQAGTLNLANSTVSTNLATGGDGGTGGAGTTPNPRAGGDGGAGGAGLGAGLYIQAGSVSISNTTISANNASGGLGMTGGNGTSGGNGGNGGAGGDAKGGGIYVQATTGLTISGTSAFTSNQLNGGDGGWGGSGGSGNSSGVQGGGNGGASGAGGAAQGGAMYVEGGTVTLNTVNASQNTAVGGDAGTFPGFGGDGSSGAGGAGGDGGDGGAAEGGGLYVFRGVTTLNSCTLAQNALTGGNASDGEAGGNGNHTAGGRVGGNGGAGGNGGVARGGGIFTEAGTASAEIRSCTLNNNTVTGGLAGDGDVGGYGTNGARGGHGGAGGVGGAAQGGGVYRTGGSATMTIANSTITLNTLTARNGGNGANGSGQGPTTAPFGNGGAGGNTGAAEGGGICNAAGTLNVNNCTVSHNTATGGTTAGTGGTGATAGANGTVVAPLGGGGRRIAGTLTSNSTIWSNNTCTGSPEFSGALTAGATLFLSTTGATITPGTGTNVTGDPLLLALAANGGPTQTRAINTGSPAINAGTNPMTLTTDQRGSGYIRSASGGVDIGAFEIQPTVTVPTPVVLTPGAPQVLNAPSISVTGTAQALTTVRIYRDVNSNGIIDGPDGAALDTIALTGATTSWSLTAPLNQDALNLFLVDATDASLNVSAAAQVPDVTEDSTAPAVPVVTVPATPVTVSTSTTNIQGTAEADSLVRIYEDTNGNNTIDVGENVANSVQLSGGQTAFTVQVSLASGTANNFLATATDAAGNESAVTDVPTITHQSSTLVPPPVVTTPGTVVTVSTPNYSIGGTAQANALVTIYSDVNNNNIVDSGEPVAGSLQLTGGQTAFSISVALAASSANNFLATATDASLNESAPTNVPTITHQPAGTGGTVGGGGGGGGGCSTDNSSAPLWGLLGVMAAMFAVLRGFFTRRTE